MLDLGAGTGLLTDQLVAAGHDVLAVDPSGEMLGQLTRRLPQVTAQVGGAERLPVPDGSVDAVVGQVAHWFDPARAAPEVRRVLRPGGVLGLVWNTRDERVSWVGALGAARAAEARDSEADQSVVERFAAALPAEVHTRTSGVAQTLTPEQVVGGIGTRSYVVTMTAADRERFLGGLRRLLATHPDAAGAGRLELPYVTRSYRLVPR